MAMTETKIVQVENSPSTINSMNNTWGHFGWSVLNVQVTHSQDSRTYTRGLDYFTGDKTVETTTINYATITYQRDKEMYNYRKIVALENEYMNCLDKIDGIYSGAANDTISYTIFFIALVLCFPVAFIYLIWKILMKVKNNSYLNENGGKINELRNRCEEIFREADAAALGR